MFIYFILLICFYMLFFFFLFFKIFFVFFFFFSSRRRHTRYIGDWSSHVCSSDLRRSGRTASRRCSGTTPGTGSASPSGGRGDRGHQLVVDGPASPEAQHPVAEGHQDALQQQIGRASCRERG